jgi:DNA-binding transcriptional MerR regulator
MNETTLDLDGLVDEANRQLRKTPDLADTEPFTKRTVYYYAAEGLLPRTSRRRGPGTTYPVEFVDRLLMIRRLQKERSLTLAQISEVMDSAHPTTITRVARGAEPLEIRISASQEEIDERAARGEETLSLQSRSFGRGRRSADRAALSSDAREPPALQANFSLRESPEHLATVVEETGTRYGEADSSTEHRYEIGEHAVLLVDKDLTPLQRKRLDQVVELLRSMLEEED